MFQTVNRAEKAMADQGFEVRRLDKEGIKQQLQAYFDAGRADAARCGRCPVDGGKMRIFQRRKPRTVEEQEATAVKDFFDQLLPGAIRFYPDSCVCGNTWRSVWAVKEYPPSTEEQAHPVPPGQP